METEKGNYLTILLQRIEKLNDYSVHNSYRNNPCSGVLETIHRFFCLLSLTDLLRKSPSKNYLPYQWVGVPKYDLCFVSGQPAVTQRRPTPSKMEWPRT